MKLAKPGNGPWDVLIASAAANADARGNGGRRAAIDPAILKAIVRKESSFIADSINPEESYVFQGATYSAANSEGRSRLIAFIRAGGDISTVRTAGGRPLNPSLGLAQVRVSTARAFLGAGLSAGQLLQPATNLDAAAALLRELFDAGITLDTIDAYNVGMGENWRRGVRNLGYRNDVARFYSDFKGHFV